MDCQSSCTTLVPPPMNQNEAFARQAGLASGVRVETQTTQATHNAIKAEELSVFIGARCLLANTELKIAEQQHTVQISTPDGVSRNVQAGTCYGLVGVNGCGKSTLLKLISDGQLLVPPAWDVFLVSQHLPTPARHCPVEEVLSADLKRTKLLNEQLALEAQISELSEDDSKLMCEASSRLLEVHTDLLKWDGARKDVIQILLALGFRRSSQNGCGSSEPTIETPMNELSGGWRMKVQLAKALWLQPKLLLLDEPSNHLDFQALQWLQEKLEQYPHTVVVVSHDVSFLHDVCREIIWINELKLESLPRDTVSQDDLLRMQRRRALTFTFTTPACDDAANHGISLHGVEFSYGSSGSSTSSSGREPRRLRIKKEIRFSGSSRSVLLGRNGSGKSTFLDLCAGALTPSRGNVDHTPDLKIGHYSQLTEALDRNSTDTAASYLVRECAEELATHAGSTRSTRLRSSLTASTSKHGDGQGNLAKKASNQQKRLLEIARGVLSRFGFEGDLAITVPVDRLSGGQKALLKFAVLSLRPVHILLLDEPTNHLDAEACEALAKGLSEFKGGIVAVTHDELLIYRMIHCNWSTSDLLICREGSVWHERNFGAHCLNTLRKEVHKAEEAELKSGRRHQAEGALRRSDKQCGQSYEPQQVEGSKSVKVIKKAELPPWLQSRRRPRDKQAHPVVPDSANVPVELVPPELAAPASALEQTLPMANQSSPPLAKSDAYIDIVERDDAYGSDASTTTPEGEATEELVMTVGLKSPKALKGTEEKKGRHSRFRKDLVNFNKALKKWIRKEELGEVSNSQVQEYIRNSHVAEHLRDLHGQDFDEDKFVQDALAGAKEHH